LQSVDQQRFNLQYFSAGVLLLLSCRNVTEVERRKNLCFWGKTRFFLLPLKEQDIVGGRKFVFFLVN
jgi:hypothetical protein